MLALSIPVVVPDIHRSGRFHGQYSQPL